VQDASETSDLQELSDPEFFAHWAAVRTRLFRTRKGKPGHSELRRRYDAVAAEYRRRLAPRDGTASPATEQEEETRHV
jgi:hypothetical protein